MRAAAMDARSGLSAGRVLEELYELGHPERLQPHDIRGEL
jgi:hypothetical protein